MTRNFKDSIFFQQGGISILFVLPVVCTVRSSAFHGLFVLSAAFSSPFPVTKIGDAR